MILSLYEELCAKAKTMKKKEIHRLFFYNLALFITIICAISCVDKENELDDFIFETANTKSETIEYDLVDCLNKSNKKIINLSRIASNQTRDARTLKLFLKIKRDHQKMDAELKKLTEKNLIILPKLMQGLNLNSDSLKIKKADCYLSNILENEIQNQVRLLDQIQKTTQNIDFKLFVIESKKKVYDNNEMLNNADAILVSN